MEVVQYDNEKNIVVRFDYGGLVHTAWSAFIKGIVKSVYDKKVFDIGYIGEGEYKTNINGNVTPQYTAWYHMMTRCYDHKYKEKRKTNLECSVNKEWHNFQSFSQWYDENYYKVDDERMMLDKDILKKGNKEYSSYTCIYVPERINNLFVKCDSKRGDLPIGVVYDKRKNRFISQCRDGYKNNNLGMFDNPIEAFNRYKIYKEQIIKRTANEYRDKIPIVLYESLINYKVDIND
jgi:hypothetical protein